MRLHSLIRLGCKSRTFSLTREKVRLLRHASSLHTSCSTRGHIWRMNLRTISTRRQTELTTAGMKRDAERSDDNNEATLEGLVSKVGVDVTRKRRINKNVLDEIVKLLETGGASIGDNGTFLMKCCTKNLLPDASSETIMKSCHELCQAIEKERKLVVENFEILLQCYTENEFTDFNPKKLLEDSKACYVKTGTPSTLLSNKLYYLSLLSYCQRGDLENAVEILNMVKREGLYVDTKYFDALILGNSRAGDLKAAKKIMDLMMSSSVYPTSKTYIALIQACIEHRNFDMMNYFHDLGKRNVEFSEHDYIQLASKAIFHKNSIAFNEVISWLPGASKTHDSLNTFNLLVSIIHSGYPNEAFEILKQWANGVNLSREGLGVSFIKEIVYANTDFPTLISICQELKNQGYDSYSLNAAAEFSIRKGRFETVLLLFQLMKEEGLPLRAHYFWPIIIENFNNDGLIGMTKALKSMTRFDVLPDLDTYNEQVIPRLFSIEPNSVEVAKVLKDSGLSYSSGSFRAIILYLLKHQRLAEASSFVQKVKGELIQPQVILDLVFRSLFQIDARDKISSNIKLTIPILKAIYENKPSADKTDYIGKFVVRFVESIGDGMPELLNTLFRGIEVGKIPISDTAAMLLEIKVQRKWNLKIEDTLVFIENHSPKKLFAHPKEMNLYELECHAVELKAKDMNARGVLRKLFMEYCNKNELNKALEVKLEFEKLGPLSPGMKGALLGAYTRKESSEAAYQIYQEITSTLSSEENWSFDLYKLLDLVSLLAKNRRKEEAFSILLTDGLRLAQPEKTDSLTRNCVKMLEAFRWESSSSQVDDRDFVLEIVNFLLENRIAVPSSPLLSVVISNLINRKELTKAVTLFENYATKYKLTPSNQLLGYSVMKDKALLEKYISACTLVHGKTSVQHQLAYSFSDTGNIQEASRLFSELGKKLDLVRILKYCDYLADRKEIKKIMNLVKSIMGTRLHVNSSTMLMVALKSCQRQENREGMNLILETLEELNISPTTSVFQYANKVKNQLKMDT